MKMKIVQTQIQWIVTKLKLEEITQKEAYESLMELYRTGWKHAYSHGYEKGYEVGWENGAYRLPRRS